MCRIGVAFIFVISAIVLAGCQATTTNPPQQEPPAAISFEIESDFGDEAAWMPAYLARCGDALIRLMDHPDLAPPDSIRVELRRVENHPGIAGWAAAPEGHIDGHHYQLFMIGFESAVWPEDRDRHWIVAHELANIFAHHYGGGGGYPSDFWSNGRSPFPEYLSCVVMRDAGFPEDAERRRDVNRHHADHALYWTLDEQYGFALFSRFFRLLRADGVRIGDLGTAPWPAPDRQRSLYTITYLSIAADRNLAPIFRAAGVGREPEDWKRIHPEIPFVEYEVRDEEVAALMAEREPSSERRRGGTHLTGGDELEGHSSRPFLAADHVL